MCISKKTIIPDFLNILKKKSPKSIEMSPRYMRSWPSDCKVIVTTVTRIWKVNTHTQTYTHTNTWGVNIQYDLNELLNWKPIDINYTLYIVFRTMFKTETLLLIFQESLKDMSLFIYFVSIFTTSFIVCWYWPLTLWKRMLSMTIMSYIHLFMKY